MSFVRNLKVLDNSLDYSLNNTAKQALWLPTSREAKYKAKQAVDAFLAWGPGEGGQLTGRTTEDDFTRAVIDRDPLAG